MPRRAMLQKNRKSVQFPVQTLIVRMVSVAGCSSYVVGLMVGRRRCRRGISRSSGNGK